MKMSHTVSTSIFAVVPTAATATAITTTIAGGAFVSVPTII